MVRESDGRRGQENIPIGENEEVGEKDHGQTEVRIFFGPHTKRKDQLPAREYFEECDVFLPEHPDWNEAIQSIYNKVSKGEITPKEGLGELRKHTSFPSFQLAELEMVYKSGKPVAFADLSSNDPAIEELFSANDHLKEAFNALVLEDKEDFQQAIMSFRSAVSDFGAKHKDREKKIAENLEQTLKAVVNKNPDLKDKKEIKVLMTLGAAHSGVYHLLNRSKIKVTVDYPEKPYVYGYNYEISRRAMFGKEISDAMVCRAAASALLSEVLRKDKINLNNINSLTVEKFSRACIDKFSDEEIISLLKNLRGVDSKSKLDYFKSQLEQKQIVLPRTQKEFEAYL